MSVEMIQQRLLDYDCKTVHDQENALKEIAQEIALMALSRAGFFKVAAFQGGTCLRILYGLDRFSEDLDFVLEEKNVDFNWEPYISTMHDEFNAYGYSLEVKNKSKLNKTIKTVFLKTDSEGGILVIRDSKSNRTKMQIKLEIDTNPPQGSLYELNYLDFPLTYSIQSQDLSSLFASKCHALLCRDYVKGRDWYDFNWYVTRKAPLNFSLLQEALNQAGSWQGQHPSVTPAWFLQKLRTKIKNIDWEMAKKDVERFLRPKEQETLALWSQEFFLSRVDKMKGYL